MRALATGLLLAAVAGGSAPCFAESPKAELKYVSAKDLAALVADKAKSPIAKQVAADPSATTLMIRRDESGEVEVHAQVNDIIVVASGHATMLVGGQVSGNHEIAPTEWRGGTITGGGRHELAPGDLLLIPAGIPHQCLVASGGSVEYLTVKTPATAH